MRINDAIWDELEAENRTLKKQVAELEAENQAIVAKIAEGSLDGYRDLAQRLNQAEAALAWYTRWASVRLARERGGSWSSRSDTERFNLIVQAAVDLDIARAEERSTT